MYHILELHMRLLLGYAKDESGGRLGNESEGEKDEEREDNNLF